MPMLLEDVAEETSAGNQHLADRLDEESRELEELRRAEQVLKDRISYHVFRHPRQ